MGPQQVQHGPQTPCSHRPRRIQLSRPSFGDRSRGPRGNDDASRLLKHDPHRLHLSHDQERRNQGTMFNLCQHHRRHHHQGRRSQQGILNAEGKGNECADEGQDLVTKTKANVVTAEADLVAKNGAVATALSAKNTACAATVAFSVNLDTLQVNECFDYKTQDSYIQKKNVCDSKTTAWNTATNAIAPAETKVTDAKSAAVDAETSASGLKVTCQCGAKKGNADAWAKVQEGHASHAADWKQAN